MDHSIFNLKQRIGLGLCLVFAVLSIALLLVIDPVPQDINYHQFSDQKAFFGLPNALNVLSNLPFLVVGLYGMWQLRSAYILQIEAKNIAAYRILFIAVALVSLGSSYYHYAPNNQSLVWDRLPMTLAFMALISVMIGEFISVKWAKKALAPLLLLGLSSVIYWYISEQLGNGDLRFYAFVQFYPMLAILLILSCFKDNVQTTSHYWLLLAAYVGAKLSEHFDQAIAQELGVISGHSIKHILAAVGVYLLLKGLQKR